MNIVERSKLILLDIGASPILYLMIALSVVSVAIMVERYAVLLPRPREPAAPRAASCRWRWARVTSPRRASSSCSRGRPRPPSWPPVWRGSQQGPAAVEEAMSGASAVQRMRLERRLGFLGYARLERAFRRACSVP